LIGISLDEVQRAKPSRTSWITNCYPLLDSAITREGCLNLLREFGLPTPQKSACVFCPYHDDSYWYDLKTKHPDEWQRAVAIDSAIRNLTRASVEQPCYLHASCMPLPLVELKPRHVGETQLGFWDSFSAECDGMCGV
jgi:hypothetical protein